jgi:NAD(P)-dependent dehydrogenase (short-subunit alcohol dehydrogenase family)
MSEQVAVVVGAGSGLGQATAIRLAAGGNTVVAVDRSEIGLQALPDGIHREVDVNVGPALWLTQAVAPYMARHGSGAIVHVAARHAAEPIPGYVTYSTSKAALVHLVCVLDAELRPQGIRVNAVAPAVIATEVNKQVAPPEVMEHAVAPEAIAEVIAFLISDAAWPVSGAIVPTYGA